MPEYLAPGVYVEETSFRAKSIEGVGTSTTGFAGPTRKGPVGGTPEVITSLGDFERVYGGLEDLSFGTNYLAHAVRAYFNEGGSRLYVSRAYQAAEGAGTASADIIANADTRERARVVARFPGRAGNGRLALRQTSAPATRRTMDSAPAGSLLRVGGTNPARPAEVEGGAPPFSLEHNNVLRMTIGGADVDVTFRGRPAEVRAADPLPDNVTLTEANNTVRMTVDGVPQVFRLTPLGQMTRDDLVETINQQMREGYARLTETNRLVVGSDRRGRLASVTVRANPLLGFTADASAQGTEDATNNVGDLLRVTADEINALLVDATRTRPAAERAGAALSPLSNRLVVSTREAGPAATLAVRDAGANSVHNALLLAPRDPAEPPLAGLPGAAISYYVKRGNDWRDENNQALVLTGLAPDAAPEGGADLLTLTVVAEDGSGNVAIFEDLGFDPSHPRFVGQVLRTNPTRRSEALENLFALEIGTNVSPHELRAGLFPGGEERIMTLSGGSDGLEPSQAAYEPALAEFEKLEDISIVAAPGYSAYDDYRGIQSALIVHAEKRRSYRIAVLDTPPEQAISEARAERGRIDSKYAALYYPWVTVSNPLTRLGDESIPRELTLPPSGFLCGIYARNDVERGVHKAPANEVVRSALRFETDINFAQQEVLNPLGVNCLRYFPGRGYRVWGARTTSSDPEWKYINVRRYFNYLESSLDRGTQWAVFEPNGERLWANIRNTVADFLYNEWVSGALLGSSAKEAFFVRCDRSTMTQYDIDNGRLICLVGVAALKPAEFVIFRIGQQTAESRS